MTVRPQLHPKKVSGDELQANATRLKKYVRDIADAIFESSVIAPLSVRQLSQSVLRISTQIQASKTVKRDPKAVCAWRTRAENEKRGGLGAGDAHRGALMKPMRRTLRASCSTTCSSPRSCGLTSLAS